MEIYKDLILENNLIQARSSYVTQFPSTGYIYIVKFQNANQILTFGATFN